MSDALLSQAEIDALLNQRTRDPAVMESTAEAPAVKSQRETTSNSPGSPAFAQVPQHPNLEMILDIPLKITVSLGQVKKPLREVLSLGPGMLVELERLAGEPVDIFLNNKLIARGEVVVIEEHFGVRINQILSPRDRVKSMG